jgi:cytidine deaminase
MLNEEDAKLVALARQARARIQAPEGAAVRDDMGRSYSGASIARPALQLTALQLAVAQAVAAGARAIEAAVVVGEDTEPDVSSLAGLITPTGPVHMCMPSGEVVRSVTVLSSENGPRE